MENGVLKIIYDDEDMKRYRRENGMGELEAESVQRNMPNPKNLPIGSLRIATKFQGVRSPDGKGENDLQRLFDAPIPFSPPAGSTPTRSSPEVKFRSLQEGPSSRPSGFVPYWNPNGNNERLGLGQNREVRGDIGQGYHGHGLGYERRDGSMGNGEGGGLRGSSEMRGEDMGSLRGRERF